MISPHCWVGKVSSASERSEGLHGNTHELIRLDVLLLDLCARASASLPFGFRAGVLTYQTIESRVRAVPLGTGCNPVLSRHEYWKRHIDPYHQVRVLATRHLVVEDTRI